MLKFLPRLVRYGISNPQYMQQVSVGYRADNHNCDYCYYKRTWGEDYTKWTCAAQHVCSQFKNPYILMQALHHDEIISRYKPDGSGGLLYTYTRITRQVNIKGWPLYLILVGCDDTTPQCNAYCYYHSIRMQNKQTVAQCAHSHGCSRSGSFFDLLVPKNADLLNQFWNELNSQQP